MAANSYNAIHHDLRILVAVLPVGPFAGPDPFAADVLADPHADTAGLCEPYASDQSLVAREELDLDLLLPLNRTRYAPRALGNIGQRRGDMKLAQYGLLLVLVSLHPGNSQDVADSTLSRNYSSSREPIILSASWSVGRFYGFVQSGNVVTNIPTMQGRFVATPEASAFY